jgi:hypothetical protein
VYLEMQIVVCRGNDFFWTTSLDSISICEIGRHPLQAKITKNSRLHASLALALVLKDPTTLSLRLTLTSGRKNKGLLQAIKLSASHKPPPYTTIVSPSRLLSTFTTRSTACGWIANLAVRTVGLFVLVPAPVTITSSGRNPPQRRRSLWRPASHRCVSRSISPELVLWRPAETALEILYCSLPSAKRWIPAEALDAALDAVRRPFDSSGRGPERGSPA